MSSDQLPIVTSESADSASPSSGSNGYWRSLGELEGTPEFNEFLDREFPQAASEFPEGVSRRRWLQLMSASLALGSAAGCRYGPSEIASMVNRPEDTIPGVAKHYATNFELAGRAMHLMIGNVDGRPIKIAGNPKHPLFTSTETYDLSNGKELFASAGSDVFAQGCILQLYDPDRCKRISTRGDQGLVDSSWEAFGEYIDATREKLKAAAGKGLAIVLAPSLSPSLNRLVQKAAAEFPEAKFVQYTSIDDNAQFEAASEVAGKPAELRFNLDGAKVICCLDSDLIEGDPNALIYARQFSNGRTPKAGEMNRLYAVEATYSVTGSAADSRLPLKSSQIAPFIGKLENRIDDFLAGGQIPASEDSDPAFDKISREDQLERFVDAMAEDLVANQGKCVISVGAHQPLNVQLAALRINKKLGNFGKTVLFMPDRRSLGDIAPISLPEFSAGLENGSIDHVWILGDNPAYSAPGGLPVASQLSKLENVVYFAEFEDETAKVSNWVLPMAHQLEAWLDVSGSDGSYGVGQPQILPLLGGKSILELLSLVIGDAEEGQAIVRATANIVAGKELSSRQWRETLHQGYLAGVSADPMEGGKVDELALQGELTPGSFEGNKLEVIFTQSETIYDGRFAKNVWLQELPQPMTKIVWDNAAIVSPKTAEKLGLHQGQRSMTETVKLIVDDRSIELPVFIMPGQAAGSVTVHLGYGRKCRDEAVDSDEEVFVGTNAAPLRAQDNSHILTDVRALATSKPFKLATTQDHFAIDPHGLDITKERAAILIREGTLEQIDSEHGEEYVEHLGTHHPDLESLWTEPMEEFAKDPTVPYQWGMVIDLNKCSGCNACVIACQAENNIPVVGKEQVSRGREMHWVRMDRYFRGDAETPRISSQPVSCSHCETAPCEQVCPVAATVHTEEGINAMAYNRCIGTRYCANNCPYKVRRFNYFNYQTEYGYFYGWQQRGKLEEANRKLQQLVLNPDVTVRGRGVMEKCTYCVQRIQNAKIEARAEGRPVLDGEIQAACQCACSSGAIVFGDIKDPESMVSKWRNDPRAYAMLAELNTKPRTLYLARVRNTHPRLMTTEQLVDPSHGHGHGHGGHGEGGHGDGHGTDDHSGDDHAEGHSVDGHNEEHDANSHSEPAQH
ncbi:MAG: TAT-variant-translocated molybdopterin oxidoreductase [Planctomycetota bacterium]